MGFDEEGHLYMQSSHKHHGLDTPMSREKNCSWTGLITLIKRSLRRETQRVLGNFFTHFIAKPGSHRVLFIEEIGFRIKSGTTDIF